MEEMTRSVQPDVEFDEFLAFEIPRPEDAFAGEDMIVFVREGDDWFSGYSGYVPATVDDDQLGLWAQNQLDWFFHGSRSEAEAVVEKRRE